MIRTLAFQNEIQKGRLRLNCGDVLEYWEQNSSLEIVEIPFSEQI